MDTWAILLPLILLLAIIAGALWDSHTKRTKRATHLRAYPNLEALRATLDPTKYQPIKAANTRTGELKAARAIMRDYPGLKLTEAADLARTL
jgi:hypothetical protein